MSDYHETRLERDGRREILWRTLCRFHFSRFIVPAYTVLELGCGYGDFINNVACARRIAVDSWAGAASHLQPGVAFHNTVASDLSAIADHSVDFIFASNLFEHLAREEFYRCLNEVKRVLRQAGTLNILQPNYRFCYDEYFDDYTHVSIYSDRSICDLLRANGLKIIQSVPRFLPLTIKSRLPVSPLLIRAYLASPLKPLAKQMFIRAGLADPKDGGSKP
jgi:SAM-dependent methyltransferase